MGTKWLKGVSEQEILLKLAVEMEINLKRTIESMAKDIYKMIRDDVSKWYKSHETETYRRTYQFLNSLSISNVKVRREGTIVYHEIEVFFDENKLVENDQGGWISHKTPSGQREFYFDMMENGWEIPWLLDKNIEGTGAIGSAIDWLEAGNFLKQMKIKLSQNGIVIK